MSTKIYRAWRLPVSKLNHFLGELEKQILPITMKRFTRMTSTLKTGKVFEVVEERAGRMDINRLSDIPFHWSEAAELLAVKASNTIVPSAFIMDSGLNIWIRRGKAYVIPYFHCHGLKSVTLPDYVKDYSYWDNVDKPESITSRDWSARGRLWETITDDWDKNRMTHDFVHFGRNIRVWKITQNTIATLLKELT